jgi:hypothetical protein
MKKVAILLSASLVLGVASSVMAADPAKISGEVSFKGIAGRNDSMTEFHPKTWETGKLSANGNINSQLSYTFGIKYDMPSAGADTNNFPGGGNALQLQLDKAAITYQHKSLPLSVTLGKNAIVGAKTSYWDSLSNNMGAEGVAMKYDAAKNLSIQALVQPNDKEDTTSVSLPNVWVDYKAPIGDFGLNLSRARAAGETYTNYSVEGSVPLAKTPVTLVGELIKKHDVDQMNYIVGAKATMGKNNFFVETTDQAYEYDHVAKQITSVQPRIHATAIGVSRNIAGADASLKYAMMSDNSSKLSGEVKVKF